MTQTKEMRLNLRACHSSQDRMRRLSLIGIIAPQTLTLRRTYNGTFRNICLIRYY